VRALHSGLAAAVGIALLTACTSGQSAIEPPSTQVNVQATTVLQFRVGTARYANGSVYLNTLTTYRQPNGLSGTLYNSPTITGPAGFVVPAAGSAGTDAGTNHISSTPPTQPGTPAVATTFNQTGGVFAYGFAPANSTTTGAANYAQFGGFGAANNAIYADDASTIIVGGGAGNTATNIIGGDAGTFAFAYVQPFYIPVQNKLPFLLGPPLTADIHNGSFPAGFLGYDSGFTMFGAAPVAGTYNLTVNVPSANIGQLAATFSVNAPLTSTAGLPPEVPPTAESTVGTPPSGGSPGCGGNPGGGASFTVAPAVAPINNQVLYIIDVSSSTGAPTIYSFNAGAAGGTFVLSATSGPKIPSGSSAPFCAGDSVYSYVVGADYDIAGLAPPANTQQAPTLPAQADVSVSPVYEVQYTGAAGPLTGVKRLPASGHHILK
jgi:hypothetical protein